MHPTPFVQTSVQLPNGLQVVFIEASHFHSSLISLYVNTGSRFETKEERSFSPSRTYAFSWNQALPKRLSS